MFGTPENGRWNNILDRCLNPKSKGYRRYGGRGITVCARWRESFQAFYEDMGPVPFAGAQLDRRDNDGPYAKWNCHWVTPRENSRNRSNALKFQFNGTLQPLKAICEQLGIAYWTVRNRLRRGDAFEEAIRPTPPQLRRHAPYRYPLEPGAPPLVEMCARLGLNPVTVYGRLADGDDLRDLLRPRRTKQQFPRVDPSITKKALRGH